MKPLKYRKKPVVIEAVRYTKARIADVLDFVPCTLIRYDAELNDYFIRTLEGDHRCTEGDMIIQGIAGEFYPCKADIFSETYEQVIE